MVHIHTHAYTETYRRNFERKRDIDIKRKFQNLSGIKSFTATRIPKN